MTKRQFVTKSGDTFEWEETPELKKFIKAQELRNKHLNPPPERPA